MDNQSPTKKRERTSEKSSPTAYVQQGRAQEALKGIPTGSARLVSFSPPYLDNVDYERSAEAGDNRFGWDNLANENRVPDGHPAKEKETGSEKNLQDHRSSYISEHLEVCKQIRRITAKDSVVAVEIDGVRENGEFRLIDLVGDWREMLEAMGFRIAEAITLGRKIAVSRRGAQMMREEETYRRPGYFAPANVTSTLLVGFQGNPQERLRRESSVGQDGFDREWAKRHMKSLWMLQPPGKDRMDRDGHPCPQSKAVARAIVRFYSTTGDLVVDPYGGSGTTLEAALEEGRHAAMVEPIGAFLDEAQKKAKMITGNTPLQIGENKSIVVPGEQVRLPMMSKEKEEHLRNVAYPEGGSPTERIRKMAENVNEMSDMVMTPAAMSLALRGERQYYNT